MSNDLIFNNFSLPFRDKSAACEGVKIFLKVLQILNKKFHLKVVHFDTSIDVSLNNIELCSGFYIRDWYSITKNDAALREYRSVINSFETMQPVFSNTNFSKKDTDYDVRVKANDTVSDIFIAAHYFETFLLSFQNDDTWKTPFIPAVIEKIDEENLEIVQSKIELLNISNEQHLETHKSILEKNKKELEETSEQLLKNFSTLYENLELLDKAKTFLKTFSYGSGHLAAIINSFHILNLFVEEWKKGTYEDYQHTYLTELGLSTEISSESATVFKTEKLRKLREFWLPHGEKEYFENHIKLGSLRIHFYPTTDINGEKIIYIGYIGKHLPTKKHK